MSCVVSGFVFMAVAGGVGAKGACVLCCAHRVLLVRCTGDESRLA